MPFPILVVPVAIAVVAVSGALITAIPKIWKILDKRTVAILGAPQTGKTALIRLLRDVNAPDGSLANTAPGDNRGRFRLEIKGRTVDFAVPRDLPGSDGLNVAGWKEAFADADHVWYLFRADLIASGESETTQMMKTHLALFSRWLGAMSGNAPKILLVGTWADEHPDHARHPARVAREVEDADVVNLGSVKLGGAAVVVGSLATSRDADRLLRGIKNRLQ